MTCMSAMASSWVTWRRQVGEVGVASASSTGGSASSSTGAFCSKVVDFLERRTAPIDEVIGAMGDASGLGPLPVRLEARVGAVATLGRLDPGEFDAAVGDRIPIDIALELGHVDAVDRVVVRLEMVARRDVAREDPVRFQWAAAAATRDQRGHRKRRTSNGPGNQPLEARQHSPCPPPFPARAAGEDEYYEHTADKFKLF